MCLEFCGFGENWWNLLVHVLQHSPILQILKFKDDDMVLSLIKSENSCIEAYVMFGFRFKV